jgi:hypothetical protein
MTQHGTTCTTLYRTTCVALSCSENQPILASDFRPLTADEVRLVVALFSSAVRPVVALFSSVVRPVGWPSSLLKYACCSSSTLQCRFCPTKVLLSALLVLFRNQHCLNSSTPSSPHLLNLTNENSECPLTLTLLLSS